MPTKSQMKKEWWGGHYEDLLAIIDSAKKHHIPIKPVRRGDILCKFSDKSYLKVLYAYDGIHTPVGTTDINDMSVIAMLYNKKIKVLFTGDLNSKLGSWLAKNAKDIKADILKFPHHGAESFAPNSFFKTVGAKTYLVPGLKGLWCSKRGRRARDIVKQYEYYHNGFNGNITVYLNGVNYIVKPQQQSKYACE